MTLAVFVCDLFCLFVFAKMLDFITRRERRGDKEKKEIKGKRDGNEGEKGKEK